MVCIAFWPCRIVFALSSLQGVNTLVDVPAPGAAGLPEGVDNTLIEDAVRSRMAELQGRLQRREHEIEVGAAVRPLTNVAPSRVRAGRSLGTATWAGAAILLTSRGCLSAVHCLD